MNAALVGLETSEALVTRYRTVFELLDTLILAVFVAELGIRIVSYLPRPGQFFHDGWNLFDLGIVMLSLLPGPGAMPPLPGSRDYSAWSGSSPCSPTCG